AILACPLGCGSDWCIAGQCDGAEQSLSQACVIPASPGCCCDRIASADSNHRCPSDAPCKSSCQGVCGGAVVARPSELNEASVATVQPQVDPELAVFSRLAVHDSHHVWQPIHRLSAGNHGRSVRMLHMSLLL
ncbi:MAG: hypothetical protein WD070_03270, partial [Pirellulaceae bacterium]